MSLIIIHPAAPRAAPIYTKAFNLFLPTGGILPLALSFLLASLSGEKFDESHVIPPRISTGILRRKRVAKEGLTKNPGDTL